MPFATQLLPRMEGVQDHMFESRNLVCRSGNVDELLSLLLRGSHGSNVQKELVEVRDAEDGVGTLESGFQRGNVIVVGRSELCTGFNESFGAGRVLVARYATDFPAFLQHAASDGTSKAAGGAADYDEFGHWLFQYRFVGCSKFKPVFGAER